MKNKVLLMSLFTVMLIVLFTTYISADEIVEAWDVSATENDSVTAYVCEVPNSNGYCALTVSGKGKMKDWSWGSAPWYSSYSEKIISATIENGVTNIGNDAFFCCRALRSVEIGDSVTKIGTRTFGWCSNLYNIVIGNNVTSIGEYAFYYCTSLVSVIIPENITFIGEYTFANCTGLKIYCEAEEIPSGWGLNWNPDDCPVVWGYFDEEAFLEEIFTFKGYSFGFVGQISVGYDIDYEAIALYEEKTGKTLEIGVLFAGFDNLGGKQPLDENGQAITLNVGKVINADLTNFDFPSYDFVLNDIVESIRDVKLVISAYICDGEGVWYIQENGLSETVSGISYNEAKESIGE